MKKSMIFVGMLAIGYAKAQEGNVGINTDQPKATLDIQPNATNLAGTTNQGILAPRLSKVRVANIKTPVEGTLVYVTDEIASPISAYTGTDAKVAKITEKGYYFYNGAEWVKTGDSDTSSTEASKWINDNTNTLVKLSRLSNGTTNRSDARNLFITDVGNVGIGTPTPEVSLHIKKGAAHIQIERNSENRNSAGIVALKSRGTADAPAAVQAADHLFSVVAGGHNGTEMAKSKAGFYMTASENWTDTTNGTNMLFLTTDNGTTNATEKMRITDTGNVGIGATNPKVKVAIGNNYNGIDVIENEGIFLVSTGTSALDAGVRSIGVVEISSDVNNNYSPSNGRFEGIKFNTANTQRMVITETGKVRVNDLANASATTDRPVAVAADGTLKIGTLSTYTAGQAIDITNNKVSVKSPVNTPTGNYTLAETDNHGFVYINSSSAVNVTVPSTLPIGFSCVVVQKGTGQVTIVGGTGVTRETARGSKTRVRYSAVGIIKDTASTFTITGDAVN